MDNTLRKTICTLALPAGIAALGLLFPDAALAQGVNADIAVPAAAVNGPGWLAMARWSPYVAGGLMGVLSWLTFLLSDQRLGVSTAYVQTAGMIERAAGARVEENRYFAKAMPFIDWGWLFVAGLVLGALLSALLSGDFRWQAVPELWAVTVSPATLVRWVIALFGGLLVGFGARWAGGCTSGHGISGTLQLVLVSWLAVALFFLGGMLSVRLIH